VLGIQYAKALGYKVIGIDIVDSQLKEAKDSGADCTFNSMTDKDLFEENKGYHRRRVSCGRQFHSLETGLRLDPGPTASRRHYDDCGDSPEGAHSQCS
jgi:threonine dehydrogenase-like Zn-dependent dehydrogenase